MYTIETLLATFKINDNVRITYIDSSRVIYGTVKEYGEDISLTVDRIPNGLGWVPVNHPNVLVEKL